jgi:outer membrane receptor protein involved in Fe transport
MFEANSTAWRGLSADTSYQFANATVTQFNATSAVQANLIGKRLPEVPRQSISTQLRYTHPRLATFIVNALYEGNEFDDDLNTLVLHPYPRFDLYAERNIGRGFSLYASSQNVLNRVIDAGKTPTPTAAAPRIVEGGVRFILSK